MFVTGRPPIVTCLASLAVAVVAGSCAPYNRVGLDDHPRVVAHKVNFQASRNLGNTAAYGPWLVMGARGSAFPTSTLNESLYHPIRGCSLYASLSVSLLNGYPEGAALDVVIQSDRWYSLDRAFDVAGRELACERVSPREQEINDPTESVRIDLDPLYLSDHLATGLRIYVAGLNPGAGIAYVYVSPAYLRGLLDAISIAAQVPSSAQ
jgi:hypothetical protein